MGNWIPNDPTLVAQILKISSSYSPPPPEGFISPMTWGVENNVIERFAGAGVPKEKISFARDTYTFNYPGAPSELRYRIQKILRANHECVRSRRKKRPSSRSAEGTGGSLQQPKQKPEQGCDFHSGNLLARYGVV